MVGSSVLGLRGHLEVWTASIVADILFVAGSVGVFVAQAHLATRGLPGTVASVGGGYLAHWLVYAISWAVATDTAPDAWLFRFVGEVGVFGLLFAAVAPAMAAGFMHARGRRRAAEMAPVQASQPRTDAEPAAGAEPLASTSAEPTTRYHAATIHDGDER